MKNTILISVLGAACLLAACSSPKPGTPEAAAATEREAKEKAVKAVTKSIEDAPDWYTNPPVEANAIYATGSALSSDMQMALDSAGMAAKREMAGQLSNRLSSKMKEFVSEGGGASDSAYQRESEFVTKNVIAEVNLAGSRREKSKVVQQGEKYRAYVLLRYPIGEANKVLVEQIRKSSQLDAKVRSSKAFQDLEREIDQVRKQGQ